MTAKIFAVINQKGGCGKTMTSMQLSGGFASFDLGVFLSDMDPQNTASLWSLAATDDNPFPAKVLSLAPLKGQFVERLQSLVDKYDIIIIDCPPAIDSPVAWAALLVADVAIIPTFPTMDNVWASKQAEELAIAAMEQRKAANPHDQLKAAYLLGNMKRGNVYDACVQALRKQARLPILNATIANRVAYPESQLFGTAVSFSGNQQVKAEMEALTREVAILAGINLPKKKGKK